MADIMSITGQHSERTTRRYLAKRRDRSLQESSESVSSALQLQKVEDLPAQRVNVECTENVVSEKQNCMDAAVWASPAKVAFQSCTFTGCTFNFNG
jgi:hypothetical protein